MAKELIAGIDEAGRGAVIGSLVVGGVSIEKSREGELNALKLRDSKELTPKRRETLAKKIEEIAEDVILIRVSACRIDNMMKAGINLNKIEAMKFSDILALLKPQCTYVDSPDVKPDRFKEFLRKSSGNEGRLVVEHKADSNYPIVSAASIVAKVARDKEIAELSKKWGDLGPGYSSNDRTIAWMKDWISKNKEWPDIVRAGWQTSKTIKAEHGQKSIFGFIRKGKGC